MEMPSNDMKLNQRTHMITSPQHIIYDSNKSSKLTRD